MPKPQDKANFLFGIANHLRGPYKPNQYGKVMLPMAVLRRLDCVLEPTKAKVLAAAEKYEDKPEEVREKLLNRAAGHQFHNTSKLDFKALKANPTHLARDLTQYIKRFSPRARDIIEHFSSAPMSAAMSHRAAKPWRGSSSIAWSRTRTFSIGSCLIATSSGW
jgi:type I restriction enzyme M protein